MSFSDCVCVLSSVQCKRLGERRFVSFCLPRSVRCHSLPAAFLLYIYTHTHAIPFLPRLRQISGGDIVALAMHPTGQYIATADRGHRPKVWIWDATSGNEVACFRNFHRGCIPVLAFSGLADEGGRRLVSCAVCVRCFIFVSLSLFVFALFGRGFA